MSLLSALPAPSKQHAAPIAVAPASSMAVMSLSKEAPPYLRRQGFVPRKPDDFGDGGAFPEIHVAQYPLDMGKAGAKSSQQLAVTLSADGKINYDAILKQGANKDRVVHSEHGALVPKVDRLSKEVRTPPRPRLRPRLAASAGALASGWTLGWLDSAVLLQAS